MKAGYWHRLVKKDINNERVDPVLWSLIKEYLDLESQVLEIGSVTGSLACQLAPFCLSVEASDFSAEILKAKEGESPKNFHFSFQEEPQLSFEDDSFDLVLGVNLLHKVSDIDQVVTELYRVLRPGSLLIIQVPTFKEQQFVSIITRLAMQMIKFRLWSGASYEKLLIEKGFSIELSKETQPGSLSVIIVAKKR